VSLKERISQIDRATAGQLALFLIGASLIIVAPAAGAPTGPTLDIEDPVSKDSVSENASIVEFQELSPDTQDTVRRALGDPDHEIRLSEDDDTSVLIEYRYIRYDGSYYEFYVESGDGAKLLQVLLVGGLGAIAIVAAGICRLGSA
jgi:hypothetical protein